MNQSYYTVLGNALLADQPGAASPLPSLPSGHMSDAQIDKTAKSFEAMFISEMLQPMFGDTEGPDAFGGAESNDIYKGMMMDEYGKQITRSGGIGIADYVKKELLKLQEKG